ncbi:OmpA family protein [Alcanivorax sediminis]|uniref:OmpA family protein n=1 Tax=Alcanivorax sediminis TaxID=2663008 RepID=A0A6N7M202_9GAMM|nr:OmpA family protein [Alcanivorax sediminis]MQX54511.1 OmpA family protein [Alcanivorax sediminis]
MICSWPVALLVSGLLVVAGSSTYAGSWKASPDRTFYVGYRAGIAISDLDVPSETLTGDQGGSFSQGLFAGYQFESRWGAELFWLDAGSADVVSRETGATRGLADLEVYGVGATWRHEYAPALDAFVQAGVASLDRQYRYYADVQGDSETDPYLVLGLRWAPADSWQLRAGYTYFNSQLQVATVGLVKHFYPGGKPESVLTAPEPEMAEQVVMQCDDFILHFDGVEFDTASVALSEQSRSRLDALSEELRALPDDIEIEIRAHADEVGTESYNYALSQVRARAVRDYLASTGIALSRIHAVGYGEWVLPGSGEADRTHEGGRRAELTLLGIEKYLDEGVHCQELIKGYDMGKSFPES